MCYNVSLLNPAELGTRYEEIISFEKPFKTEPVYYRNAFSTPVHPVIPNDDFKIKEFTWGLIPFWVKTEHDAEKIRMKTMNARAESIFKKPSYRSAIIQRRCLIPVDGFFEWRYYNGRNYPYYIYFQNHEIFSIAGIWETWMNPGSQENVHTFSLITCKANSLLEKIHNKKKRMPVILPKDREADYVKNDLTMNEIKEFLVPIDALKLTAHTISKLVTSKIRKRNVAEVIKPVKYPELPEI